MISKKYVMYITLGALLTGLPATALVNLSVNEHLWSHKKEKDESVKKAFRGGRTARQEYKKAHVQKTIKTMSFDELIVRKNELVASNDKAMAIKYVEKLIPLCDDLEQKGLMMLEMANLHFDLGNLKKAQGMYKEFKSLYPSHDKAEYAFHQEIVCSFLTILDADRDQTKTKDTIELADTFLTRSAFKTYDKDVATIKRQCLQRELDSEVSVFNFYLNKGSVRAAEQRLSKIEQNHSPKLPEAPAIISDLKVALAQRKSEIFGVPVTNADNNALIAFNKTEAKDIEEKNKERELASLGAKIPTSQTANS